MVALSLIYLGRNGPKNIAYWHCNSFWKKAFEGEDVVRSLVKIWPAEDYMFRTAWRKRRGDPNFSPNRMFARMSIRRVTL
mmetsp:Transcript_47950/g.101936  ORF Transcript_47950/g.101936 Transcript_47950/m.101936 type:complete len:80 (-) Transcript_47950:46-285(-)